MTGKSECRACGRIFKWRRSKDGKPGTYCSKECKAKFVHTWCHKNRFIWSKASKTERLRAMTEKFEKYVIRQEGCWDWSGCIHHSGYAPFKALKQMFAHVASWIIHNGPIKKGLHVLHSCDNKKCTNPKHLFLGTPKDNTQDMLQKGRGNKPIGSSHKNSKLNEEKVREIKKLLSLGVTMVRLQKDFSISKGALAAIKNGITWKHVD